MRKLLALFAFAFASSAHAAPWTVDSTRSTLTFEGQQGGDTFHGGFKHFTAEIVFDAAQLPASHIAVTVDTASVFADDADRTAALPGEDWFAVKQFPEARFTSSQIRHVGSDKNGAEGYEATGELTIRGFRKPITLPFTLATHGDPAEARGTLALNRHDFGIGQGRFASDSLVKQPVSVAFTLFANRAASK